MSKFATRTRPNITSPLKVGVPTFTYEGGQGYAYDDPKTALFLLAATNMVREDTFYEDASSRDTRFVDLIHQVAASDPDWLRRFAPFLRRQMLMRSASVVLAAEYVASGAPGGRQVVSEALWRADEPAEILGYWMQEKGRKIPAALKRGVADAVSRLFTPRAAAKYDGTGRVWRMGDVIELVHPRPSSDEQSALFKHLLDARHHGDGQMDLSRFVTWEKANPTSAAEWEALVPKMGYMALLRNLRNFDKYGVSDEVAARVCERLSNPEEVANSRQFPLRFLSAWKATGSMRWGQALEKALDLSVRNIPRLKGRTLILVDTSGSMRSALSARSSVSRDEVAMVFGLALAKACESYDIMSYSDQGYWFKFQPGESILRAKDRFPFIGSGTYTWAAYQKGWDGHDRTVILTDEQAHDSDPGGGVVYTFNLASYRQGHAPHGQKGRYVFSGLTDAGFRLLPMLEDLREGTWPWES